MKKLLLFFSLLGFGTSCAQEIKSATPEYYAQCFEELFCHGFMLGLGTSEMGIDAYFEIVASVTSIAPEEIFHQAFLNTLPQIDPMGLHKRVYSAEEYYDLTLGEQREFSIGFLTGGYLCAWYSVGEGDSLTPQKVSQIHTLCEYIYVNVLSGAVKDARKK